jgi:hypothetical protein
MMINSSSQALSGPSDSLLHLLLHHLWLTMLVPYLYRFIRVVDVWLHIVKNCRSSDHRVPACWRDSVFVLVQFGLKTADQYSGNLELGVGVTASHFGDHHQKVAPRNDVSDGSVSDNLLWHFDFLLEVILLPRSNPLSEIVK